MSWSGSVGVPGSLASSRRWNQRGRSISTASNAVAMLAFARSISSAVSRFRCPRCACSGAPAMNATIDSTDSPSPTVRILPSWSRVRLPVPGGLEREKLGVETASRKQLLVRALVDQLAALRSEEHTSELQSHSDLVCRLLLEKKKKKKCSEL